VNKPVQKRHSDIYVADGLGLQATECAK